MPRHLLVVPALCLGFVLTACGSTPGTDAGAKPTTATITGRVTTSDKVASFEVPDGFHAPTSELDGVVTFAAFRGGDESDPEAEQIFVSSFPKVDDAEAAAIYGATTLSAQGGTCTRIRKDTAYGSEHRVVDCAFTDPEAFHKVFVAIGDAKHGALLVFAGPAKTQADLAPIAKPVLDSWEWK